MKRNMGKADRVIRTFLGLGIFLFYANGYIPRTVAPVLLVIAGVLIITSIFAVCPLYNLFNISTSSSPRKKINE